MEEQEGDKLPPVTEMRVARRQPCSETRMERLKQRIDMLTELVSTLVVALGQNAANMAPVIPPEILLLTRRARRLSLLKRAGMPRPVRQELTPWHIEGTLGVDIKTSPRQHEGTANPLQNPARLSTLGIQFSTYLNGQ